MARGPMGLGGGRPGRMGAHVGAVNRNPHDRSTCRKGSCRLLHGCRALHDMYDHARTRDRRSALVSLVSAPLACPVIGFRIPRD